MQVGSRITVPGIRHSGVVTEIVPPLNQLRFVSDLDGLSRRIDISAAETSGEKAAESAKNKARGGAKNKGAEQAN